MTRPDPDTVAALSGAIADVTGGRRLRSAEARELAAQLRAINAAFGPSRSRMAKRMADAADLLDSQAGHRRRPR